MAYDEPLAERIRQALGARPDITEKKMFGGIAFLLDGKMFCGIVRDQLMVRVGPERYQEALGQPHAGPMDFTGRPMNGYVFVAPAGCSTERRSGRGSRWAPSSPPRWTPALGTSARSGCRVHHDARHGRRSSLFTCRSGGG